MKTAFRKGITLIELLVGIGIIAVLIGLLLPAIQKVRHLAAFTQGQSQLRQIILATHTFTEAHSNLLPRNMTQWEAQSANYYSGDQSAFYHTVHADLLPYVEQNALYGWVFFQKRSPYASSVNTKINLFQNPLDPTQSTAGNGPVTSDFACSYVSNAQVFSMTRSVVGGIPDGLTNTIFFAEHYRVCRAMQFDIFDINNSFRYYVVPPNSGAWQGTAPTFADCGYSPFNPPEPPETDFYPITKGNPQRSIADGNVTFQTKPAIANCDPRLPNSASSQGLQVAMGDGSVRTISSGIDPYVFWAAVTPNGAEQEIPDF